MSSPRLGSGCFVEASAGTGKTRRLVEEIVAAIASGVPVGRIVAVTFTHAAAGSMKIRIRQALEARKLAASDPEERERLKAAVQSLDRAFIGTIHAFCANLLRQRPVEACVDPDFIELTQPDALRVFSGVFRSWIEGKLAHPSPAFRRALARLAWEQERSPSGPLEKLEKAAWSLAEWRDYDAPWERRPFRRDEAIAALVAQTKALVARRGRCSNRGDELYRCLAPVADMLETLERAAKAEVEDLDNVETELLSVKHRVKYTNKGSGKYGDGVSRESVLEAWEQLKVAIEEFRVIADADLAPALRAEMWEAIEQFQAVKRRAGQLDFTDLLIFTRDLLQNPHARGDLQARYDRLYIDEFQDTDPLQAEILLLLCANNPSHGEWLSTTPAEGKLFLVGDPKQSIYRFRRADARQYDRIRTHLLNAGLPRDQLQASHRSTDAIQHFVNAAFDLTIADYLPLSGGVPAPVSQPSVVALPVPRMHGTRNVAPKVIREWSPTTTAAFIEWLTSEDCRWTVRDPSSGERVKIEAGHICVLFRKLVSYETDLTQEYVRALEARNIDHVLVGSKSFHQREEIGTIRTALRAVEWPDDELSVFAVLRGSLFFIEDTTLFKFREQFRAFSPLRPLPDDLDPEFARIGDVLRLLKELHKKRNYRPPAETIRHLLEHARAHAGFAFHHGGERRLANVYRLSDLARSFELSGPVSFRAFVEHLEHEYDLGEQSEAPVLEQQAGGVQLMTVHKAKGLEFPVVILADLTTNMTRRDGSDRYIDPQRKLCAQRLCGWAPWELTDHRGEEDLEDRAEGVRIAYVAATRARDLLVVSALGACEWEESWLAPLYPALYPPGDQWRTPSQHPGCQVAGQLTVFEAPGDARDNIRPGMHRPRAGMHEVFWFDPKLIDIGERDAGGLDHDGLLFPDADRKRKGLDLYQSWRSARTATIGHASEPRYRVRLASEAGDAPEARAIPLEVVSTAKTGQRPSGRNFGKLVHAILQSGHSGNVEELAALHGRRWNASELEIAAAGAIARSALAHPALGAGAKEIYRELPVSVTLASGEIAEGVIDLAWTDGVSWTVVDYKTGKAERRYESQLRLYALAIQRATGLPAKAVLMEI